MANNTSLPYQDRVLQDEGLDLIQDAIIQGIASIGIGVPEEVKKRALGFDVSSKLAVKGIMEQAMKLAQQLLVNEQIGDLLNQTLQPSPDAAGLGKNIQQQLHHSISSASLPALAQLQQYTGSSGDQPYERKEIESDMIERLGGEGGGEEQESEADESVEGSETGQPSSPQTGESTEPSQAPPESAVNIPEEAKESAVSEQGLINLSDEAPDKHKERLAEFASKEQAKQLGEQGEDGGEGETEQLDQEDQESQAMGETGMAAQLQRAQQQDRQRKGRSMEIQASQQRIQEAAAASEAEMGGGEADIAGEARSKSAGGSLTERGVARAGEHIGQSIKAKMKNGEFKGFAYAMVVAISKDAIDWMEPTGLLPALVSAFLGGILTAILLGEGTYFKRLLIKRFLGKAIIAVIAEFIPGFNLFPTYSIGILLMKYEADKQVKQQKKHYNIVAQEVDSLKKRVMGRPQPSE